MKTSRAVAVLVVFGSMLMNSEFSVAGEPCGHWKGRWCSTSNGRSGRLSARVSKTDGSTYQVRFTGTFLKVIPFTYSVPLTVTGQGEDGSTHLSGQAQLPMFGHFCCNAVVTDCDFVASYSSPKDQGQFLLRRR